MTIPSSPKAGFNRAIDSIVVLPRIHPSWLIMPSSVCILTISSLDKPLIEQMLLFDEMKEQTLHVQFEFVAIL